MTRLSKRILTGTALVALTVPLLGLQGCNMGQYEEPANRAEKFEGGFEIREYKPMIAAEAITTGERREAINAGFRIIADYIFGNNQPNAKIAMTTPVIQQAEKGQKIAMTAPVIQQSEGEKRWKTQFIMPSEYTMRTLPKPNNPAVKLKEIPARKMVVLRFSGTTGDQKLAQKIEELRAYARAKNLKTVGEPTLAFYDPPWTPWFMKRNEVLWELRP